MAERIQNYVVDWVRELGRIDPDTLVRKRFEKFRSIGSVKH
jgi:acetyl-CoA carboxylase alpha subunit